MHLLEDFKISLLNFNLFMIYIIHKMLALLEITWIILRIPFPNTFLRSIIDFDFLLKYFFWQHIMIESLSLEEENVFLD